MTWFYFILLILFLLMVIILTGIVLIQEPKSGGLAASLGGGGLESFLGARGAPTFFMKATWIMGGLYMVLSLTLSLISARTTQGSTTIEREVKSGELYKKLAPLIPGTEERK